MANTPNESPARTPCIANLELFIDGKWHGGDGRKGEDVLNPSTEKPLAHLPHASKADLDQALEAAKKGFAVWRATSAYDRCKIMHKAADLMRERHDAIAKIMVLEQGKTYPEARAEVIGSADIIDWYAEEGRRSYGRIVPGRGKGVRQLVVQEPIGVVAAFTPWNFPVLTPARKIGGALAAGCSLILKASEETPGACIELVRCFADAGVPAGVLNLVFGVPAEVSEYLLSKDLVRKISFTGSIPVGKHLAALAAKGMKRTTMELGGHSPVVVFADADPEKAADTIAAFKYRNAGQVCISPTRFYVQEDVYPRFLKRFTEYANGIKLGDGMEKGITMGPMANARRIDAMESFVNDAKQPRRQDRDRRQAARQSRLLLRADGDHRSARRRQDHDAGAVRPGRAGRHVQDFRRGGRARQLAGIRPRRLRLHHVERHRRRDRRRAGVRHGRRQLGRDLDAGDAVRRRQRERPRQRRRRRGLGRLSRHQIHLAGLRRQRADDCDDGNRRDRKSRRFFWLTKNETNRRFATFRTRMCCSCGNTPLTETGVPKPTAGTNSDEDDCRAVAGWEDDGSSMDILAAMFAYLVCLAGIVTGLVMSFVVFFSPPGEFSSAPATNAIAMVAATEPRYRGADLVGQDGCQDQRPSLTDQ